MNISIRLGLILSLGFLITGCIAVSQNPIVSRPGDMVLDPLLEGVWEELIAEDARKPCIKEGAILIIKREKGFYHINLIIEKNEQIIPMKLTQIAGSQYADYQLLDEKSNEVSHIFSTFRTEAVPSGSKMYWRLQKGDVYTNEVESGRMKGSVKKLRGIMGTSNKETTLEAPTASIRKFVAENPGDTLFQGQRCEFLRVGDSVNESDVDPVSLTERGVEAFNQQKYDLALRHFTRTILLQPDVPLGYANRAVSYERIGRYILAAKDFAEVIKLDPAAVDAYFGRANNYILQGDIHKAVRDLEKVVELAPNHADANNSLAWIYATTMFNTQLHGDRALELALKATSLKKESHEYIDTLAAAYAVTGQIDKALIEYERASRLGGKSFVTYYQKDLKSKGYYGGKVDGIFGSHMRTAIRNCLKASCLPGLVP